MWSLENSTNLPAINISHWATKIQNWSCSHQNLWQAPMRMQNHWLSCYLLCCHGKAKAKANSTLVAEFVVSWNSVICTSTCWCCNKDQRPVLQFLFLKEIRLARLSSGQKYFPLKRGKANSTLLVFKLSFIPFLKFDLETVWHPSQVIQVGNMSRWAKSTLL